MSISDKAFLVSLSISQWQARKLDKRVTSDVAIQHGVHTTAGRYNKVLLPATDLLNRIHAKTSVMRKWFYTNTLPWGIEGTQLLPSYNLMTFRSEYAQHKAEWESVVRVFVAEYPRLVGEAKKNLNGMFNTSDYPDQSEIASKFSIDIALLPVPNTDFRVSVADEELEEMKNELEGRLKNAQDVAMAEVKNRLYERVETVAEKLADPTNIFKDSLIGNVVETCDLIKRLNFTDDPDLEAIRLEVENTIGKCNPDVLRLDPIYREQTCTMAKMILHSLKA